MTIVLPENSQDLAVPSKQLAAGHKDTLCDPQSSSFITAEPQIQRKNPLSGILFKPKLIFCLVIHLKGECGLKSPQAVEVERRDGN